MDGYTRERERKERAIVPSRGLIVISRGLTGITDVASMYPDF